MSLVWIDCIRRLKKEAQDAAKEEEEKSLKRKEVAKKKTEMKSSSPSQSKTSANKHRKVSFNAVIHVSDFFCLHIWKMKTRLNFKNSNTQCLKKSYKNYFL